MVEANRQAHDTGEAADRIPPDLLRRFDRIREQGYETMPSAQTAGVFNLSAPILASDGTAIAALTIPFIGRVNAPDAPDLLDATQMLVKTSRELAEIVGARALATD
jgi:DNA-binding IclR family transcriptional regulator